MELQVCATCFWTIHTQLNTDGMTLLNKKIDMSGSIKLFDKYQTSGHPCSDTVHVHLPTSAKLRISHSAKKINHENRSQ